MYSDEYSEDSGNVVLNCNEMAILNIDLNNINLDNNFDEDDPDNIILIRLSAWHITFEERKTFKKKLNEELMPIEWHPKRWRNWCLSEDEKKEIDPMFIKEL